MYHKTMNKEFIKTHFFSKEEIKRLNPEEKLKAKLITNEEYTDEILNQGFKYGEPKT